MLIPFITSGINVTGDLDVLAKLAESNGGFSILCLVVLCVILVAILIGVRANNKSIIDLLKQTLEGYTRLSVSLDDLSDAQNDLKDWLKENTAQMKKEIQEHQAKLDRHDKQINKLENEKAKR